MAKGGDLDAYIMPSSGREPRKSSPAAVGGLGRTSACKMRPQSRLDTFNTSVMESRLVQSQICRPDRYPRSRSRLRMTMRIKANSKVRRENITGLDQLP